MSAALIFAEFGDDCDLYEALGVARSATAKDITKAYRRLALRYVRVVCFSVSLRIFVVIASCHGQHPDKHRGDEQSRAKATATFQAVSAIHSLLSDAETRALYDETGAIPSADHEKSPSFQMWVEYFARIFPKVSADDIAQFEKEYRFSDEERRDVLAAYVKFEGDMSKLMDSIMLSTDDDEERFADMIEDAIKDKQVKRFSKFKEYAKKRAEASKKPNSAAQQKKKQAKRAKEAQEAEDLFAMIRNNQQRRANGDSTALAKR